MSGFQAASLGGSVTTGEVADGAITYTKLQNVSATARLLGRFTAGAGVPEEITPANARTLLALANFYDAYAAGTAYSLTNTAAALTFGTTQPAITLAVAGTYRIRGRVNLKLNGATLAAPQVVTLKLRRTNNTAADLANGALTFAAGIVTTLTQGLGLLILPEIGYVAGAGDIVTIFGSIAVVPSVGSVDAIEASISAEQIA